MKILHIYNDYYPSVFGGIEKHINIICEGLKHKFQIQVLAAGGRFITKVENINNIAVIRCGELTRFQSAPICPTMPLWLKKIDCDILHFHLPCPTAMISYFLAKPKGKLIVTYHSDIVRQRWAIGIYGPLLLRFLKKADCIIASSPNYIESSPYLRKFKDKCVVIPYGIDIYKFHKGSPQSPTILFVGKLRYYKGLEYLISAMKNIEAKLLLIGTGNEPRLCAQGRGEEKKLKNLTLKLNLQNKISFLGNVLEEELSDYYSNCSVFVLPSIERSEAFGIVQLEAMASGKPVVSTQLDTGVPWVNQDGVTGIVVPPKDSNALADAVNKLLKDNVLREQLGKNARKRVESEFTKELMLNRIAEMYFSLD